MLPLCFCAFLAFGAVLVLLGANQASLAAELGLDLARSGLLASALALGLGAGVVIAGPLFDRYPRRPLFVGSALLAAAALLGVEREMSYARWLAHAAAAGAGIGLYDTLINAVVVQRYREHAARPMLAVHSAATIGAMLSPAARRLDRVGAPLHRELRRSGLGARGDRGLGGVRAAARLRSRAARHRTVGAGRALAIAQLLPLAAVAFAYVGVESSVTMFAVPYASGALGLDAARGQRAIGAFWLGLLVGRVALLAVRTALDARILVAAGAIAAALVAASAGVGAPLELALLRSRRRARLRLSADDRARGPGRAVRARHRGRPRRGRGRARRRRRALGHGRGRRRGGNRASASPASRSGAARSRWLPAVSRRVR